jgi:4-aminobutyrate aminotransferase-like enzyme
MRITPPLTISRTDIEKAITTMSILL